MSDPYPDLRDRLAGALERAAAAQLAGRHAEIDDGFDGLDVVIPRNEDPRFIKLLIAVAFWDGWIDSWNHAWNFYEPLTEEDWPRLAASVAADLRADREIQNERVLEQFGRRRPQAGSLWTRLRGTFGVR